MEADFPLPEVQDRLAPYVQSRHDTLRIRRVLTVYLNRQLQRPEGDETDGGSCILPHAENVTVRQIPRELSGLRREYLEALQRQSAAQRQYDALAARPRASSEDPTWPMKRDGGTQDDATEMLQAYLTLLRQRQKYEKMQSLQDFQETLSRKAPAQPDFLDVAEMSKDLPTRPDPADVADHRVVQNLGPASGEMDEVNARMKQLKMAVLRARHALEHEKAQMARIESMRHRHGEEGRDDTEDDPAARMLALARTRDGLVQWVEEELGKANDQSEPPSEGEDVSTPSFDHYAAIHAVRKRYEDYLVARTSLLNEVSSVEMCRAFLDGPTSAPGSPTKTVRKEESPRATDATAHVALQSLTTHLLPLSRQRAAVLEQKAHLAMALGRRQQDSRRTLDRLAHESHLLPAYPFLANEPRFKHAAAAISARSFPGSSRNPAEQKSDVVSKAEGWAFAAQAARTASHEAVEDRLAVGEASLAHTTMLLEEVRTLLGAGPDESERSIQRGVEGGRQEDIWTEDVPRKPRHQTKRSHSHDGKSKRKKAVARGLWQMMDGNLEVR
ncbi:MAG: hypothetical protein M1838_001957 [Thelocarpon superellum]|nr:MAG: hypothetical protein M1838_001957 [Thelocarpon superellum]